MTQIESIRQYLSGFLNEMGMQRKYFGVDWLDQNPDSYSIDTVPANPVVRRYVDGSSLRQYLFVFASRRDYSQDVLQNMENLGFFEDFESWIERQSAAGVLPEMPDGLIPQKIEATGYGYLLSGENNGRGRYQIQCRLMYTKGV